MILKPRYDVMESRDMSREIMQSWMFRLHRHDFKLIDCARPLVCECGEEKGDNYENNKKTIS